MAKDAEIRQSLKRFIDNQLPDGSMVCTVDSVNMTDLTCYCVSSNGSADVYGVRLMAKASTGFLIVPTVGSDVVVTFIDDENAYVSMFSEVESILLNGDSYGELIQIDALTTKLNQRIATIKTATTAALTAIDSAIASLGAPAAVGMTAWNTAIASDGNFNKNDYRNTTVKHGNGT